MCQHAARGLEAITVGQIEIHQDNVRLKHLCLLRGLNAIACLTCYYKVLLFLQYLAHCVSHQLVVIDNENLHHVITISLSTSYAPINDGSRLARNVYSAHPYTLHYKYPF